MDLTLPKRIKTWDELRGFAISFMIFTHFFYYKSTATTFYHLKPIKIFSHVSGFFELFKGILNLHASYLAPFLFLFIVGIICHIKFTRQDGPDFQSAVKRFLKLYFSTIALSLIFSFNNDNLSHIDYFKLLFYTIKSHNILMVIAYVYLVNEFILHSIFQYYDQKLSSKMIFIITFGLLIIIFNFYTKTIYPTRHTLPLFLIVMFGLYSALLGDLFLDIKEKTKNKQNLIYYYIIIPAIICFFSLILIKPTMGSIKEMNIIYFMYCFSLSAIIIEILDFSFENKFCVRIKKILSLLGRHSLGLYIFHFFIGFMIEKYILIKFIPKDYWPINIIFVFIFCLLMALLLDNYKRILKFSIQSKKIEAAGS